MVQLRDRQGVKIDGELCGGGKEKKQRLGGNPSGRRERSPPALFDSPPRTSRDPTDPSKMTVFGVLFFHSKRSPIDHVFFPLLERTYNERCL
jgi:hypothetical protein